MMQPQNYMQEEEKNLQQAIQEVVEKAVEKNLSITDFKYDSKNCGGEIDPVAGPGIKCIIEINKEKYPMFFPLKEYPSIEQFIDSLNFDGALLKAITFYPQLMISGGGLSHDGIQITYAHQEIWVRPLKAFYDFTTCEIDSKIFKTAANQAIMSQGKTRSVLSSGLNIEGLPEKIRPPFVLDKSRFVKPTIQPSV